MTLRQLNIILHYWPSISSPCRLTYELRTALQEAKADLAGGHFVVESVDVHMKRI